MRKLLILAAVAILAPAGMGCQCGPIRGWLCKGYDAKCGNHCVETCDPCMGGSIGGCNAGPSFGEVVPGATYIPGPIAN
jgi:hypothetical protein